ncbi:hypothetical protein [Bacillus sp. B-jedd]|uniref:hypothetical protein n=1 Tax=Bacillus sp. B-jedd TaxID=1476857 RepID=UPI001E288673|nr:hypothetical protein [Bacillus sp. B-jedd]
MRFQEMTVFVNGSSRFNGNQHDTVYVHTTIVTDAPLTEPYYVPAGVSLPNPALDLIRMHGLEYRPYRASVLTAGTENIMQSSLAGDTTDTLSDSARLILLSALKEKQLDLVAQIGNSFVYELKYEYKIFPLSNSNDYQFEIRLPFDGIQMVNGSRVQLTVVTPSGAVVNDVETRGIDENGQEIQELVQQLQNSNRSVVSFYYQLDPHFVVRYSHTESLFQG